MSCVVRFKWKQFIVFVAGKAPCGALQCNMYVAVWRLYIQPTLDSGKGAGIYRVISNTSALFHLLISNEIAYNLFGIAKSVHMLSTE